MAALAPGRLSAMLQHVALEIRPEQIQDCADFYRLLGFEEVAPPETIADRAAWVEREGTQVHLLKTDEPTVLPSGHLAVVAATSSRSWPGRPADAELARQVAADRPVAAPDERVRSACDREKSPSTRRLTKVGR